MCLLNTLDSVGIVFLFFSDNGAFSLLVLHRFKAHTLEPSNFSVTSHQRASLHTLIACWGSHTSSQKAEKPRETHSSWKGVPLDNRAGRPNRPSSWYIRMFGSGLGLQLLSTYWFREVPQWACPLEVSSSFRRPHKKLTSLMVSRQLLVQKMNLKVIPSEMIRSGKPRKIINQPVRHLFCVPRMTDGLSVGGRAGVLKGMVSLRSYDHTKLYSRTLRSKKPNAPVFCLLH